MSRLWALGMPLANVIRAATVHPAQVLGEGGQLGTLKVGTPADISILEVRREAWRFADGRYDCIDVGERLLPWLTLREGVAHEPCPDMMPDLYDARLAASRQAAAA
jgi:dihydroorotase